MGGTRADCANAWVERRYAEINACRTSLKEEDKRRKKLFCLENMRLTTVSCRFPSPPFVDEYRRTFRPVQDSHS
jgi:hypothetical protein